jgi:hypothetical protein
MNSFYTVIVDKQYLQPETVLLISELPPVAHIEPLSVEKKSVNGPSGFLNGLYILMSKHGVLVLFSNHIVLT